MWENELSFTAVYSLQVEQAAQNGGNAGNAPDVTSRGNYVLVICFNFLNSL